MLTQPNKEKFVVVLVRWNRPRISITRVHVDNLDFMLNNYKAIFKQSNMTC